MLKGKMCLHWTEKSRRFTPLPPPQFLLLAPSGPLEETRIVAIPQDSKACFYLPSRSTVGNLMWVGKEKDVTWWILTCWQKVRVASATFPLILLTYTLPSYGSSFYKILCSRSYMLTCLTPRKTDLMHPQNHSLQYSVIGQTLPRRWPHYVNECSRNTLIKISA